MQSLEENGINGYFYEKINYDNVFEDLSENISDNYGICVSDSLGHNIYSYDTFTDKNKEYNLSLPEITKKYPDKNKNYFIVKKTIPETGWNVWLYKPEKLMGTSIRQINIITFGGTLVCLVATFMCIRYGNICNYKNRKTSKGCCKGGKRRFFIYTEYHKPGRDR